MKLQDASYCVKNLSCRICIWGMRHVSVGHGPPQGCLNLGSMAQAHSVHCTFSGAGSEGPTTHTGSFQKAEFGHGGEALIKALLWQTRTRVWPNEELALVSPLSKGAPLLVEEWHLIMKVWKYHASINGHKSLSKWNPHDNTRWDSYDSRDFVIFQIAYSCAIALSVLSAPL